MRWVGAPFLVMPAIAGHIIGRAAGPRPLADRGRPRAQHHGAWQLHRHASPPSTASTGAPAGLAGVVPERDNATELAYWRDYLAWYADGTALVPALRRGPRLVRGAPSVGEPEPSLLWGDVRLGNVIFDETARPGRRPRLGDGDDRRCRARPGVDAHARGPAAELFRRTIPGFFDHDAGVARYEARLGRSVQDLDWYEILAMVRSTAIMTRVAASPRSCGPAGTVPDRRQPDPRDPAAPHRRSICSLKIFSAPRRSRSEAVKEDQDGRQPMTIPGTASNPAPTRWPSWCGRAPATPNVGLRFEGQRWTWAEVEREMEVRGAFLAGSRCAAGPSPRRRAARQRARVPLPARRRRPVGAAVWSASTRPVGAPSSHATSATPTARRSSPTPPTRTCSTASTSARRPDG